MEASPSGHPSYPLVVPLLRPRCPFLVRRCFVFAVWWRLRMAWVGLQCTSVSYGKGRRLGLGRSGGKTFTCRHDVAPKNAASTGKLSSIPVSSEVVSKEKERGQDGVGRRDHLLTGSVVLQYFQAALLRAFRFTVSPQVIRETATRMRSTGRTE